MRIKGRCFGFSDSNNCNWARGKVVCTESLVKGLKNEKISGACLDVLEYEKSNFENLFDENTPEALKYLLNAPSSAEPVQQRFAGVVRLENCLFVAKRGRGQGARGRGRDRVRDRDRLSS